MFPRRAPFSPGAAVGAGNAEGTERTKFPIVLEPRSGEELTKKQAELGYVVKDGFKEA